MNFLDLFDGCSNLDRLVEQDRRSGPCEDDCEVTAPYIGMLPDESDHEDGSPLNFKGFEGRKVQ
jgi:hypothetical protein